MDIDLHLFDFTKPGYRGDWFGNARFSSLPNAGYDDVIYDGKRYLVQKIVHDLDNGKTLMYLSLWS